MTNPPISQEVMRRKGLLVVLAAIALISAPHKAHAQWDLRTDWSGVFNPNGVWSFGYRTVNNLSSTSLTVYDQYGLQFGWSDYWTSAGLPSVYHNLTGTTQVFNTVVMSGYEVALHPGPAGEYSVVRFTAPNTGWFDFDTHFRGTDCCATSTDANVLFNGSLMFSGLVNGFGVQQDFLGTYHLNAGDIVDFAVGDGYNDTYFFDSTGLDVTIDQVPAPVTAAPEPASLALLATGLLVIGAATSRSRRTRRA